MNQQIEILFYASDSRLWSQQFFCNPEQKMKMRRMRRMRIRMEDEDRDEEYEATPPGDDRIINFSPVLWLVWKLCSWFGYRMLIF